MNDTLIRRQGLEYSAELRSGHVVRYLSKDTAEAYAENYGAKIIAPVQGPQRPHHFDVDAFTRTARKAALICKLGELCRDVKHRELLTAEEIADALIDFNGEWNEVYCK